MLLTLATALGGATIPDLITFALASTIVLVGGIYVVLSRNPVHSALSLIATLFGVAILFVAQEAHFLAAVQVIVYAGAIVVLFLFVIMLLGVDKAEDQSIDWASPAPVVGSLLAALVLVSLVVVGGKHFDIAIAGTQPTSAGATAEPLQPICIAKPTFVVASGTPTPCPGDPTKILNPRANQPGVTGLANIRAVGRDVFTGELLAFEATAILLVIAVVGTVVLAKRPRNALSLPEVDVDLDAYEAALNAPPMSMTPDGSESQTINDHLGEAEKS